MNKAAVTEDAPEICWLRDESAGKRLGLNEAIFLPISDPGLTNTHTHQHKCRLVLHDCLSRTLIDTDVLVIKSVRFDVSARLQPKKISSALSHRNVPVCMVRKNYIVVFSDYSLMCVCVCVLNALRVVHGASWRVVVPACCLCAWMLLDFIFVLCPFCFSVVLSVSQLSYLSIKLETKNSHNQHLESSPVYSRLSCVESNL